MKILIRYTPPPRYPSSDVDGDGRVRVKHTHTHTHHPRYREEKRRVAVPEMIRQSRAVTVETVSDSDAEPRRRSLREAGDVNANPARALYPSADSQRVGSRLSTSTTSSSGSSSKLPVIPTEQQHLPRQPSIANPNIPPLQARQPFIPQETFPSNPNPSILPSTQMRQISGPQQTYPANPDQSLVQSRQPSIPTPDSHLPEGALPLPPVPEDKSAFAPLNVRKPSIENPSAQTYTQKSTRQGHPPTNTRDASQDSGRPSLAGPGISQGRPSHGGAGAGMMYGRPSFAEAGRRPSAADGNMGRPSEGRKMSMERGGMI